MIRKRTVDCWKEQVFKKSYSRFITNSRFIIIALMSLGAIWFITNSGFWLPSTGGDELLELSAVSVCMCTVIVSLSDLCSGPRKILNIWFWKFVMLARVSRLDTDRRGEWLLYTRRKWCVDWMHGTGYKPAVCALTGKHSTYWRWWLGSEQLLIMDTLEKE